MWDDDADCMDDDPEDIDDDNLTDDRPDSPGSRRTGSRAVWASPPIQISTKLKRLLAEDPHGREYAVKVDRFLATCLDEGHTDDEIFLLAREHAPCREKFGRRIEDELPARIAELRAERPAAATRTRYLDWDHCLAQAKEEPRWSIPGFLPAGGSASVVSAPKVGKSLLALELAACKAQGLSFLEQDLEPAPVLYLDFENSPEEVTRRLAAMDLLSGDLSALRYWSFPSIRGLDTEQGAGEVLMAVKETGAKLVVLDTLQRCITGDESSSQSIRDLYRQFMLPLRRLGVACLRLDHLGKNSAAGARGTSAKSDDVDVAWQMRRTKGGLLELERSLSRTGREIEGFLLERRQAPLTHAVVATGSRVEEDTPWDGGEVATLVGRLDQLGLENQAGRPTAAAVLKAAGVAFKTDHLAEAVKVRKERLVP